MNFSIHRDDGRRSNLLILLTAMALAVGLITPVAAVTAGEDVSVIVTLEEGSAADPGELVAEFGGSLEQPLDITTGGTSSGSWLNTSFAGSRSCNLK